MRLRLHVIVTAALAACATPALAAPGDISTVAGTTLGFGGDGGPAVAAQLRAPTAVATTPDGGFLIADAGNQRIRAVSPDGTIVTVAGSGIRGSVGDGGPATNAQLNTPTGVAVTRDGEFLVADYGNHAVRKVRPDGSIVTVAGTLGQMGSTGDGGTATSARLSYPNAVAETADGGFLIADTSNHRVRKVFPNGTIVTVAGTGTGGFSGDGGPATAAQLNQPYDVAVTRDGGFLIADAANNRIREVRADATIVTVAGAGAAGLAGDGGLATSALLHDPMGVAATADGGFLIADSSNDRIRRVSPAGVITTAAGTTAGLSGDGGPAVAARLELPYGVAVAPNGGMLVADYDNARIRAVAGAATGGPPIAPVLPVAPARGPAFGARTNVSLSLVRSRITAAGRLGVTVRNANAFAVSGSLTGASRGTRLAARRFAVAARGRTRVTLRLSARLRARLTHAGKLAVTVTARVTDPAGDVRRVTRTLSVRVAR